MRNDGVGHAEEHYQAMGLEGVPVEAAAAVAGNRVLVDCLKETLEAQGRPVQPEQRLHSKI